MLKSIKIGVEIVMDISFKYVPIPTEPKPYQETKKLTKGGVLRKRKTLFVARLNHYCVPNA
jgi:hypothetical protein